MANICKLCAHPNQDTVKAAFASGATDRELARQFGVSHMAIGRHRRAHVVGPLKAAVAALDRGRTERQQRTQQLAAIDNGDALAVVDALFSASALAKKLDRIETRLERASEKAASDAAHRDLASLASQQLRSLETGARLSGHPSFTPRSDGLGRNSGAAPFSITIMLGGGRDVKINATPVPQPAVVEGEIAEEDELAPDSGAA